jgi:hypothetical protein
VLAVVRDQVVVAAAELGLGSLDDDVGVVLVAVFALVNERVEREVGHRSPGNRSIVLLARLAGEVDDRVISAVDSVMGVLQRSDHVDVVASSHTHEIGLVPADMRTSAGAAGR